MSENLKIIDVDKGWKELKKTLVTLRDRKSYVKAGVIGGHAAESDGHLTNAEVAAINEFGSPKMRIPARPLVGGTFEANKDKYKAQLAKGLARVYSNRLTVNQLLGLLGTSMVSDIKQSVIGGEGVMFERNAPSTIAKKGSDRPLVDTGRLIGSVQHEVVEGSDE